jgi:hypothetical protein
MLVGGTNLTRLYNPDRVRRRDLVQKGDAFKLLREMRNRVNRDIHRVVNDEQLTEIWWRNIARLMHLLVDGFSFDRLSTEGQRRSQERRTSTRNLLAVPTPGSAQTLEGASERSRCRRSGFGASSGALPLGASSSALPVPLSVQSQPSGIQPLYEKASFTDLFFWALVSGQPGMVEVIWARVEEPLRCAVVGVEACRRIRKRCFSRGRGKAQSKRLLDTMEHWLQDGTARRWEPNLQRSVRQRSVLAARALAAMQRGP